MTIALVIERKQARLELKADADGVFRCVFSTLGVVDKQGDVTLPGAFEKGATAAVSHFMHSSWADRLPVGEGTIDSNAKEAWLDGAFWLDTPSGSEHYLVCKRSSLMEWSFGFDAEEVSYDEKELEKYPGAFRILRKVKVFEVSPVLVGAGVGTHTEYVKGMTLHDQRVQALVPVKALVDRNAALVAALRKEGRAISSSRRERLGTDAEELEAAAKAVLAGAKDIRELLEETDPGKALATSAALRSAHLRHETRLRELRGLAITRAN